MAKYQQFLSRVGSNRDRAALRGIFSMFLTDDDPPALKDLVLASITLSGTETTQITISGANTTGILLSGTSSADGISITGICADGIHISGAMTASGLHISGDQVIGILYDVTAAATHGMKIAVPTGITLTAGLDINATSTGAVTSGLTMQGTGTFTAGITLSATAMTTGIAISAGSITDGILISGTTPVDGIHISSACSAAGINLSGANASAIVISGANTASGISISGDQVVGILFAATAAADAAYRATVPTGITLGAGLDINCTSTGVVTSGLTMQGTGTFTTGITLSAAAITTGILLSATTVTTGISITSATTTAISITGAATDGIKLATGAMTDGIEIASACTNGINISGICGDAIEISAAATTTGINISADCVTGITIGAQTTAGITIGATATAISIGDSPTGISFTNVGATTEHLIDVVNAYTGIVIETGTYSSSNGNGVTINATNSRPVSFLFDDAGVEIATSSDVRPVLARTAFTIDSTAAAVRFAGLRGHIKCASGIDLGGDTSEYFAVQGLIECAGATTIGAGAFAAGVCGMVWADGTFTGTGFAAGVMAKLYQTAGDTTTTSAFAATKWWNSNDTWSYGLYIEDATIDAGHDIRLQGGVTIGSGSADPNGAITSPIGSLYIRSGQAKNATFYQNVDGGTTWTLMDATTT